MYLTKAGLHVLAARLLSLCFSCWVVLPAVFAAPSDSIQTQPSAFLDCQGTGVISEGTWRHVNVLVESWADLDLKHARVIRKLYWAIVQNDMLEEHALDCGFGLATVLMVSLRAIDYDDGPAEARAVFQYLQGLLERLQPHNAAAKQAGWGFDTTDLKIYPSLLGLDAPHRCYGTSLRIFVYHLPELNRGVLHCQHGQWGLEALIPHWLLQGSCRTENPDEADLFFVPWHTWCDRMVYRMNQTRREISQVYIDLMQDRHNKLPYWERQGGKDHIFLFSDQGMNFFPEWRDYIPHSMFLVTEALTPGCGYSCFNPWKDIVLPGHTDYFRYRRMASFNKPTDQRSLLFNFHGRHPGLCDFYKDNVVRGKIMEVFMDVPGVSVGGFTDDYFERMGSSHFCLVPMGTSSWTNHLYEAFFAGCVPVILSDDFQVPFDDIINWPDFSVKWPMSDVSMDLYKYLLATPIQVLRKMKAAVDAHACWFDYHQTYEPPGEECSPYLGMIRMLERKRPLLPRSPGPFWRHDH